MGDTGRPYYHNPTTGVTQWENPLILQAQQDRLAQMTAQLEQGQRELEAQRARLAGLKTANALVTHEEELYNARKDNAQKDAATKAEIKSHQSALESEYGNNRLLTPERRERYRALQAGKTCRRLAKYPLIERLIRESLKCQTS